MRFYYPTGLVFLAWIFSSIVNAGQDAAAQQAEKPATVFFESTGLEYGQPGSTQKDFETAPPFLSRTPEYLVVFEANQARIQLPGVLPDPSPAVGGQIAMVFEGSDPRSSIKGAKKLPGKVNYYVGDNPSRWKTDLDTYQELVVEELYEGIDLRYYGKGQRLEYDFILSPGANPEQINLKFAAAEHINIESGDLVVTFAGGRIRQPKPYIYQHERGLRKEIEGRFVIKPDQQISFEIDDYASDKPLVIDPPFPFLFFSYVGGSDQHEDAKSIAVDSSGNTYITGQTTATDFPTTSGSHNPGGAGCGSCSFVSKLSANGTQLLYSTYIGGSAQDESKSIAVDAAGNAYVTGYTGSQDYPTTAGAFQTQNPVQAGGISAFVTKLNSSGQLVYSTYVGSDRADMGWGIAVDSSNRAYIVGHTASDSFPIAPVQCAPADCPYQQTMERSEAFVSRLNANGSALEFSTYLGGADIDVATAVALGQTGDVFVTGYTGSSDFDTTPGTHQTVLGGGNCPDTGGNPHPCYDVFITRLSSNGTSLVYSTLLGGNNLDIGNSIAVDILDNAYVAGRTRSTDFDTTPGAYSTVLAGNGDAFVAKINAASGTLAYSTLLGGTFSFAASHEEERAWGVAVDQSGRAIVVGETRSWNFPITSDGENCHLLDSTCGLACSYAPYGFVTRLNSTGTDLQYSTYLGGGDGIDGVQGVAVDVTGDAYVTGYTGSTGLANTGAYDTLPNGMDAFIAKIDSQLSAAMAPLHFEMQAPQFLPPGGDPIFRFKLENLSTPLIREPQIKVCVSPVDVAFTDSNVKYQRNGCCATMQLDSVAQGQAAEARLTIVPTDYEHPDMQVSARVLAAGFAPQIAQSVTLLGEAPTADTGLPRIAWLLLALLLLAFVVWYLFVRRKA